MVREQTIIIFLLIAAALVSGHSISFSFWPGNVNSKFVQGAILSAESNNNTGLSSSVNNSNHTFQVLPDLSPPRISDASLKAEKVITGLQMPTSMKFVDHDKIVILEKNGKVRLVSNGTLQPQPIFEAVVRNESERGLIGIAIANTT